MSAAGGATVHTEFVPGAPRPAYDVAGSGPATLVCLHGIGGNRRNWTEQLTALADLCRVVAWDARGYGDSDDYEGPLAFSDFTDDLLRLLDHLGVARAHLCGLSMGAGVSSWISTSVTPTASPAWCWSTRG